MHPHDDVAYIYKYVLKYNHNIQQKLWWRVKGWFTGVYKVKLVHSHCCNFGITLFLNNKYAKTEDWVDAKVD